jgi:hypothetical protein
MWGWPGMHVACFYWTLKEKFGMQCQKKHNGDSADGRPLRGLPRLSSALAANLGITQQFTY